jgi:hypothetical protein
MFEDDQYRWRETYFVLFDAKKRPRMERVKKVLAAQSDRYALANLGADDYGRFESLTLLAPDDFAALDICFTAGEEVREQAEQLIKEMRPGATSPADQARLRRIAQATGRFEILHFEQVVEAGDDDEQDEMLDPSAVLIVLGVLAKLTDGVAVDPQSGTFM